MTAIQPDFHTSPTRICFHVWDTNPFRGKQTFVSSTAGSSISAEGLERFPHRQDVRRWDVRLDVMHGVEDPPAPRGKRLDIAADVFADLLRRGGRPKWARKRL